MGIIGFVKLFKNVSLFLLKCQERLIIFKLGTFVKNNKQYLGKNYNNCSVNISADIESKKTILNNEIKNILKKCNNNSEMILEHISLNGTKILKHNNCKKILAFINEEPGLILEQKGLDALFINLIFLKKLSLKTEPMFILEEKTDIYNIIQQFYRWYYMKNGFIGFDAKTQKLLKQVNNDKNDSVMNNLQPYEIAKLRKAISIDVDSINFVVQYVRESAGSKNALNKIKEGLGANI